MQSGVGSCRLSGNFLRCLDEEAACDPCGKFSVATPCRIAGRRRRKRPAGGNTGDDTFEELLQKLFRVHDLNQNGVLEELELIQLNKKVALLHYGKDVDLAAVKTKYQELFRNRLDPEGQPVSYQTFRRYMVEVLSEIDEDERAQEMIMEQFVAEACQARAAFHFPSLASSTDAQFLLGINFDEAATFGRRWDERPWSCALNNSCQEHEVEQQQLLQEEEEPLQRALKGS